MKILAFGTYDARTHPRVGVLVEGLRAHGDDVVEVNVPLGIGTAGRVAILRQPWRLPHLMIRLARCWATLTLTGRRAYRRERPDAVLVGYLGHFDVLLARALFRRATIVLDHLVFAADTARDRGQAQLWKTRLLERLDRAALASADVVLVDTEAHAALLPRDLADRGLVVLVGASTEWFAAGEAPPLEGDRLKVVFFGLFTPLQGAPTLGRALGALADDIDIDATVIGHGQDLAAARMAAEPNPRTTWRDWAQADELPSLVAAHDVCLGIFGTGAKAARVVPNKVYQGAAAGCALVTSGTPPQRDALGDAAVYVPPGDPGALAEALRRLAADRSELARLRKVARAHAEANFVPASVVRPLRARLADRPDPQAAGRVKSSAPPLTPNASLRYAVVRRLLARARPGTILEIGCGQGSVGARLARVATYVGVEPDGKSWEVAAARVGAAGGTVLKGDQTALPPGTTYDLVCAFEVLEHIEDDKGALLEWVRLVRPGGHLMLSVPAWPERFGPTDEMAGHFRRYSPDGLKARLGGAGLVEPEAYLYGWPLGYALEAGRNRIAVRRRGQLAKMPIEERTAGSGRLFQPTRVTGPLIRAGVVPFVRAQRLVPARGTGLVAMARRPAPGPHARP